MNQDRWKQIDELFDAALDLPEAEREAFLSARTNGDDELKKEVLSLLSANKESESFLNKSAMNIAAKNLAAEETAVSNANLINKSIGNYVIEKLLGAGGMGEVYLAKDEKLRRKVALKILPSEYTTDDERVKRFQLEARAISALNHPNIVTIYDVGTYEGINYIATEYVEGKTLRELIGGNLKLKEILAIIIQACEALAAAHERKIIHRDIKPENIMVRPDGYVKILDFGLAKLSEVDLNTMRNYSATAKGIIIGTPAYMSPEQVADDDVDHRTDLWSLGVCLYELLTNINPFKKENRQATFQAILSHDPPLASSLNAEISPELDQILVKALEKDADLSYQTASDFRADLKRAKREVDSSPSLRSGSLATTRERAKTRRFYWIFASAFLFLAIGAAATAIYFWKFAEKKPQTSIWNTAITTQLTDYAGEESFPNISPDGKTLLYTRDNKGNLDIYWQRIGGTNAQNLTADSTAEDKQPAFSPNGEQIAFRSSRNGGGIFLMGATGESVRRLTDFGFTPTWSPDGKEIAFSSADFTDPLAGSRPGELWIVNLNGEKRQIKTNRPVLQPNFSPDGTKIVFYSRDERNQRDLWTVSIEGGDAVQLTKDAAFDWSPVWSPDGSFIYFCSNRNGAASLWRIAVNQKKGEPIGEPESLSSTPAQSWLLTLSKDGKNLIYARRSRIENIYKAEFDTAKMQIVGKPEAVTEGTKRMRTPDFAPDGNSIVFYVTGETQEDIILVKSGETKWNLLTNDAGRDRVPRFSPDGNQITFYSNADGHYEAYIMNADGSNRRQITKTEGKGVYYPFLSPDGKRLAYTMIESDSFINNLETDFSAQTPFKFPRVNDKGDFFIPWSWSPDGKKIAGWSGNELDIESSELFVYSIETNSYERISENFNRPAWFADNIHILGTVDDKLAVINTQTKQVREILSNMPQFINSPAISRDNRRVAFSTGTIEADIQMLSLK